jgi:hypothetical protein
VLSEYYRCVLKTVPTPWSYHLNMRLFLVAVTLASPRDLYGLSFVLYCLENFTFYMLGAKRKDEDGAPALDKRQVTYGSTHISYTVSKRANR